MSVKRILIIGYTSIGHLKRFDKYIKEINKDGKVIVEAFNLDRKEKHNLFDRTYHIKSYIPDFFFKIKNEKLITVFSWINLNLSFLRVKKYDLINIHYLTYHSFLLLPFYRKKAKRIMISPWGSDVYRIPNEIIKQQLKKVYDSADYVSVASETQFKEDIVKIFSVPEHKIINFGFGSESIDELINNESITKKVAKKELAIDNTFVITCGYNRGKIHNHLTITDSLISVKELLPPNVILFFPMTYNGEIDYEYINEIKRRLDNHNILYRIYDTYLTSKEFILIEKATDLFVYIQSSDASSASLQEFLLCGADIIKGEWLTYPQFEKYGMPYLSTPNKDTLKDTLKEYFTSLPQITIPEQLKQYIKGNAWSRVIQKWYSFYVNL